VHREVYGGTAFQSRSPLVGRSSQVRQLEALYERAARGDPAAALLWGEAGVGKTRLLDELSQRALAAGATVARAACFESLCPPFSPLRELFGSLGLDRLFDDAGTGTPAVRSDLARYQFFVRAAQTLCSDGSKPLLLIVDDLQSADFATLEFLGFLMPRLGASRLLLLGAVRSEQVERDHERLEALHRLQRHGAIAVAIPPLEDDDMRALVSSIWPQESADREKAIERVCALADGKPYFAEELVSSAILAWGAAEFNPAPLSIRAGVLARFEQLSDEQRYILLCASVIGRNFGAKLLARVSNSSQNDVGAALARARDLQLVSEIRERAGAFIFRHSITREILYRELLAFQTQTIHAEIARLAATDVDADAFDLAYHWNAAGERQRASAAYERAGDAALSRGANRDAEAAYRRAVEARDAADPGHPALCEKLSRALSVNGLVDEACAWAERAVDAYVAAGRTEDAGALAIRLARRIYESGKPQAAMAVAHRALRLSGESGPVAYDSYVTLAHFEALQGRNAAAEAYLESAERSPGEHRLTDRRNAYTVRALVAATAGRIMQAFDEYEHAVSIARELHDPEQLAWTLNNYASRAMATGWMERARHAHLDAASCLRSEEFGKVGASTIQGTAFAELLCGDLSAVRGRQQQDARLPPGIAMTQTARTALGVRQAYYAGDDDEASRFVTPEGLELAFGSGEGQRIGLLAGCVAAHYDAIGRRNDANALRSRALKKICTVDFSFWLLDQLAVSQTPAERERARELLADAAADAGNLAARAHLALFDARLARLTGSPAVKSLADDAAAKFEAIGWPWERAQALELAGRCAEALAVYRKHGFLRHARELQERRRRSRHRAGTHRLTPRELDVAKLAAAGKSNRAIATQLFIGERTVETHIAAIFDRFDLTSRSQLGSLLRDPNLQVAGEPPA
jgi:DNA-binding CsgD family transcriptional regulator